MNLTSMRDPAVAWDKLILGSLVAMDAHQFQGRERVADVGSGGGFPGIPLKLAMPELQVCLVESDQRKAAFLRDMVEALELSDVEVEHKDGQVSAAALVGEQSLLDAVSEHVAIR